MSNIAKLLNRAEYRLSVHELSQLPPDDGVEVAIAGRSNAGKSSLINRLCNRRGLARTSRTPGRTRQLVFFDLDPQRRLVDLPGYGYARVSGDMQRHWQQLIGRYLERRQSLRGLIIVMDIRHPLKDSDRQLIDWAQARGLPGHLVLTKADKLGRGKMNQSLRQVRNEIGESGFTAQTFSALKGDGVEELRAVLAAWLSIGE